ncbi:hypothetical protein SAMN02799630_01342 [Paenibacillus sp. UNCCL117]|uniref:hypothetical protein n=1 Tax=unclassified Paenibacillus TaxID=185978 RepID=UPI000889D8A2|nr:MULTISPECIES: hypothetical protein [unclassified Paenibacillus]SDC73813.1 hypothetical protein SAMN04488602_103320 [Paenibacillus sp. cl123]SFW25094.1 hypothetical protein SAMN02799630_01342 [Paenibacillus sp. UNCCL117]
MITAQRWSVFILAIILILVLILGNRHWEKSIRQQGVKPASAANLPPEPAAATSGGSATDSQVPDPAAIPAISPAAGSAEAPSAANTANPGVNGPKPTGNETKPGPNAKKENSTPAATPQKPAAADKQTGKNTTNVTKSVYQR